MISVGFGVVAACILLSALGVVRSENLVRAVLWLGVTLGSTAVLYAMLDASFLAGVQVLLYVGGVITLMIFGLMMTRRQGGRAPATEDAKPAGAALVALLFFIATAWAVMTTEGLDAPAPSTPPPSAADLGRVLLREHVLAFETISMLLLVAIVGAIVIARRRDPGSAPAPAGRAPRAALPEAAE